MLITDITNREIDRWPVGQEMQLEPRMQAITLEVILRAVFGVDEGPQLTELRDRLRALIDMGGSPLRLIPSMRMSERSGRPRGRLARLLQAKTEVDALLYDEIARRRRRSDLSERDDILSLLIQARDENGEPMTDVELRDELMTLLAAGHETTATAMAWFFEQILRRPATLHRLEDELARGETIYLDAAIRETLRVRPVVPMVVRRLKAPMDLMGYHLPAEVIVACNIVATEDLYPNAGEFSPERFIGKGSETYTWIPFGGGVRRCLGASFATFEMRTVIPEILRRTRLRAVGRRPERIRRRAVTLYPARRTRVAVETLRPAA